MTADDDRLLRLLEESLREDTAEPPPARVTALRRHVAGAADRALPRPFRTRRTSLAAAAAAGAAAVLAGLAVVQLARPSEAPREAVALEVVREGVEAEAALVAHTWGTEIELVVSGLPDGEEYAVWFDTAGGGRVSAGTFLGVGDAPLLCDLNAAVLRPAATGVEVLGPDGAVVLASDL